MKQKRIVAFASVIILPTDVWAVYLDNYSHTTSIVTAGCSNDNPPCIIDLSEGTLLEVVDDDPNTYYILENTTWINTHATLWVTLDFGVAGVIVQAAIFNTDNCNVVDTTCWVSVGNDQNPLNNPICGSMVGNAFYWNMQSCNQAGRYVSLIQNGHLSQYEMVVYDFITWSFPSIQASQILSEGVGTCVGLTKSPANVSITALNTAGDNSFGWLVATACTDNMYSLTLTTPLQIKEIYLGTFNSDATQAPIDVSVDGVICGTLLPNSSGSGFKSSRLSCSALGAAIAFKSQISTFTMTWHEMIILYQASSDPCTTATFFDQTFADVFTTTALAQNIKTQSFTEFLDSVGNVLQCGPRLYELINYTGSYLTLNSGPTIFSLVLQSLLATDNIFSPYSVIFKVSLVNHPTVFISKTLSITIGPCVVSTCSYPSMPNQTKVIGDVATLLLPKAVTQIPACGYPQVNTLLAQQLTPTAGGLLVNTIFWAFSGAEMSLQSNDVTLHGSTYTIKQKSTFNGVWCGGPSATVTWIDSCLTTVFSLPVQIPDQFGYIMTPPSKVSVVIPWVNDSTNISLIGSSTSSICGLQSYYITENGVAIPFMQVSVNASGLTLMEFSTSDVTMALTHTIQVSYSLVSYPAVPPVLLIFQLTFYNIIVPIKPSPQTYQVLLPTLNVQMGAFSLNPTNSAVTITHSACLSNFTALPAFITFSQTGTGPTAILNFAVNTSDNAQVGTYQIIVTATFILSTQPAQSQTQTFTLTVTAAPVSTITLVNQPPIFTTPVGGPFQFEYGKLWSPSYQLPSTLDPEGKSVTIAVNCGPATSFLTYNIATNTFALAKTEATNIGTYTISIVLTDADGKFSSYSFKLKITDLIVTSPTSTTTATKTSPQATSTTKTTSAPAAATVTQVLIPYDFSTVATVVSYTTTDQKTLLNLAADQYNSTNNSTLSTFDWMAAYSKAQKKDATDKSSRIILEPDVSISSISNFGLVTFAFTKSMVVPPLEMIQKATIQVKSNKRNLASMIRALQIRAKPGRDSLVSNLGLTYNITKYTSSTMTVQLNFTNAIQVSSNTGYPEFLETTFVGNFFYFDTDGKVLPKNKVVSYTLPTQMQFGSKATAVLVEVAEVANTASNSVMASNLALSIILSAGLQQLWSMVNTQQLVVLMPLWNIKLPANAAMFFGFIMTIASFDLLPTDTFYNEYFPSMAPTTAINANFQAIGFSSMYFNYNIGSLIISFLAFPVLALTARILRPLRRFRCCNWLYLQITGRIYWNSTIKTISQSYSVLVMSVCINTLNLTFASPGEIMSSCLTIFFGAVVVFFPIVMCLYLYKNFDKLETPEMDSKLSSFYSEFYIQRGRGILVTVVIFYLRRVLIPISVVYNQAIIVQICAMVASIIAQIINVGYLRPFKGGKPANIMETFNEVVLLLIMYTMMCFTDFVPDLETQYGIGYVACGLVVGHLLVNLGIMITSSLRLLTFRIKRCIILRNHKLNIIKRQNERSVAPATELLKIDGLKPPANKRRKVLSNLTTQQKTEHENEAISAQFSQDQEFSFSELPKDSVAKQNAHITENIRPQLGKVRVEDPLSFNEVCCDIQAIADIHKSYSYRSLEREFEEVRAIPAPYVEREIMSDVEYQRQMNELRELRDKNLASSCMQDIEGIEWRLEISKNILREEK